MLAVHVRLDEQRTQVQVEVQNRLVLGQREHPEPVAQVLQQAAVREVSDSLVASPQQNLASGNPEMAKTAYK